MKTQISRNSRQVLKNYSSVCHQQGRMLTDSDLTEQALISRDRLTQALRDVIGTGTPRFGALLQLAEDKSPELHWGAVYVDGVPAQVKPNPEAPDNNIFDYNLQLDYPQPPALPDSAYRLYVDIWERTIAWLDDDMLRDPGLHGADTTTRTQTVAQVKYCSMEIDPLCTDINPPVGDARLRLVLRSLSTSNDPCDPCSDELELRDPVGNYLFRVELHDVHYDENNQPDSVIVKWSSENGAEAYKTSDTPPDFSSDSYVYEFFDDITETRLGIHLARDTGSSERIIDGVRPSIVNSFSATSSAAKQHVRRWDGWCKIEQLSAGWTVTEGFEGSIDLTSSVGSGNPGHVDLDGNTVNIELRVISLALNLSDHALVAGDYWTAPVRESIHQQGEVLLEEAESGNGISPEGELHHYMLLVDVDDTSTISLPADSECDSYNACQPVQFPSLTDLNAADICYQRPECDSEPSLLSLLTTVAPSLHNTERLKLNNLLDNLLCYTSASTVPLGPEPLCQLLQDEGAQSVQDALNIICNFENDGCATFSVSAGPGWQQVFTKIPPSADAHICFQEGDYPLGETLVVENKGHLKISCAGEGTRFYHNANETVIRFKDCQSVSVTDGFFSGGNSGAGKPDDQTFAHIKGALTFENCAEVQLQHIVSQCKSATRLFASCITVINTLSKPGRVRIKECRFEVGHQQVGLLLLNQQRISVIDNQILARKKPKSMTIDYMLNDYTVASRIKDLLIKGAVVRDFDKLDIPQREGLQNLQTDRKSGNRQIMFNSPIASSQWKKLVSAETENTVISSNNALLNTLKSVAINILRNPKLRRKNAALTRWITDLKKQNPSVMSKGIVCAGDTAKEIRVLNNTITGTHMGIQVGVSNRSKDKPETLHAGITRIQGNSIQIVLSPLASRRRGGIFAGNCSQLSIIDNSIQLQRFSFTNLTKVESIRIYGVLGRKIIVKDNYSTNCNIGIKIAPVAMQDVTHQWLVADNMFAGSTTSVEAPGSVKKRNNIT
ncbi:MAG: hypothetical protein HOG41_07780 [Gammaproteobacteria bacterium]|jgi:hypothetical protein|nr:hypothetical protein [Gammaproteobacteria bacterium]MBT3723270.1 hypothetical protein [Gammaproteobacteria bacterium]MBT4862982.1 hypothetical protein [Gammaproteobacteria bacterium]MBT7209338.1 hypothetical protein [Gammaproteobacteria bacterium]